MSSDAPTSPPDVDDEVDERLKIGEVARRCGVSTRTLRYYEEVGLIAPVDSTEGGFRLYDSAVIDRVERIVRFKDVVHLSLDEIRRTLDDEDRVIAEAVLRGLRDPSSLPDPTRRADPTLAAPGLAHMIHAAGRGDAQALTLVAQMADQMSRVGGDMSRVAAVIRPLINGERNADRLCARMDTRGQQLVLQILDELGRLDLH